LKKIISIVGGGASAMFLAEALNTEKYAVSVFEKNSALGRKFLVAGDGGLNLTHSESESKFILNYTPHYFLSEAFKLYSNKDFITW
jgi:predicted flavoprotein YhiN